MAAKREAAQRLKTSGKKINSTIIMDIYQKAIDSKDIIRKDTGIVYDLSMAEHTCLWDDNYPECPERLLRVVERCKELELIQRCKYIEPRKADNHELSLKHTPVHIETLKSTENCQDLDKLEKLSSKYDAIYFHPVSCSIILKKKHYQ